MVHTKTVVRQTHMTIPGFHLNVSELVCELVSYGLRITFSLRSGDTSLTHDVQYNNRFV